MSGRTVTLQIFVEHGKETALRTTPWTRSSVRCAGMEQAFGREYDLDIFMIVAVSDFNMGAMENKGAQCLQRQVCACPPPETATDGDYAGIETVIAHEYFHNWTGNRITCRDWFQLCLKEGLDGFPRSGILVGPALASGQAHSFDVRQLRAVQFMEDAGPLCPSPYVRTRIARSTTSTHADDLRERRRGGAYAQDHGCGADNSAGMDLYFERHDGTTPATIEQFVRCFADVSGRNLDQFMLVVPSVGNARGSRRTCRYDAAAVR